MLSVYRFVGAPLETNCFLVASPNSGQAFVVDAPLQVAAQVSRRAEELGVVVSLIVCTHGHWDHIMGLPEFVAATGGFVACHALDADMLEHPSFAPFSFPYELSATSPDRTLAEGDSIEVGSHRFVVLHTPGHTPGGFCLYSAEDRILFSGDTLFAGTYGRLDLPGGDAEHMIASLHRLGGLPPDVRVCPGHGEETTIGREDWLAYAEEIEW